MRVDSLARLAPAALERSERRLDDLQARVLARAGAILERADSRLDVTAARVAAVDPAVQLARGWSITRRADGTVVRSIADVQPDDTVSIAVSDGHITSTVNQTKRSTDD